MYTLKKEILYHLINVKTEPLALLIYNEYKIIKIFPILTCQRPLRAFSCSLWESLGPCAGFPPMRILDPLCQC